MVVPSFAKGMMLFAFFSLLLLTTPSHALEFQSTTHYDNSTLYENNVNNIQYSPRWNKVIALHSRAVTILDLNTAPPTVKYYTTQPVSRPNAYFIIPSSYLLNTMAYDENSQKLILSASVFAGNSWLQKLLVLDENTNTLNENVDFSTPRGAPFNTPAGIGSMKIHNDKVYFLFYSINRGLENPYLSIDWDISTFASYDLKTGAYAETISRSRGYYYDYQTQTFRKGGPSDGVYEDFDFQEDNLYDDTFVMVTDVSTYPWNGSVADWGSILKGNVSRSYPTLLNHTKTAFVCAPPCLDCPPSDDTDTFNNCTVQCTPDDLNCTTICPGTSPNQTNATASACTFPLSCQTSGTGAWNTFYVYPNSLGKFYANYSVTLPKNLPNIQAVYKTDFGDFPLPWSCIEPHEGLGEDFNILLYLDNNWVGGAGTGTNEAVFSGVPGWKFKSMIADSPVSLDTPIPLSYKFGNTMSSLSSSLTLSVIPPHISTKITTDSDTPFIGGLRKVLTLGSDVYTMGFQLESGESFNYNLYNRKDILVLSQGTVTNLSALFSLPRSATAISRFGEDVAVTLDRNKVAVVNKTGVQFLSESLRYELYTVDGDALAGVLVVGGNAGLDVMRFKADKLITDFDVLPPEKVIYPYSDGPSGSAAEAKVNFTLSKDAKVTVTIENNLGNILTVLVSGKLYRAGHYVVSECPRVSATQEPETICWGGLLDANLLKKPSTLDTGISVAIDGMYTIKLKAKDASGGGLPDDEAIQEIEVKSQ